MTDPIFNKHGNHLEPNTHKNGVSRIDYAFCTPHLEKFIIRCGITPFDLFTSSDHRDLYLDVKKLSYLQDSSTTPSNPESGTVLTKKDMFHKYAHFDAVARTCSFSHRHCYHAGQHFPIFGVGYGTLAMMRSQM